MAAKSNPRNLIEMLLALLNSFSFVRFILPFGNSLSTFFSAKWCRYMFQDAVVRRCMIAEKENSGENLKYEIVCTHIFRLARSMHYVIGKTLVCKR